MAKSKNNRKNGKLVSKTEINTAYKILFFIYFSYFFWGGAARQAGGGTSYDWIEKRFSGSRDVFIGPCRF